MNLFKKIWNKNFIKAKEPLDKFSEDIGGIKGEFSWIKLYNGKEVDRSSFHNEITNLSKSTVIRLLAQGSSPWRSTINSSNYKISRMRFGNSPYSDNNTDLIYSYYDISEGAFRNNLTNSTEFSPAGGRYTTGTANASSDSIGAIQSREGSNFGSSIESDAILVSSYGVNWVNGATIITILNDNLLGENLDYNQERPPSHKTLSVDLLNSSNAVVATLTFNNVYSRSSVNGGTSATNVNNISSPYLSTDLNTHKIYYTPPTGTQTVGYWSVKFTLGNGAIGSVTKVLIKFKIGSFNIINSIVPVTGYNNGIGTTIDTRFPLTGGIDYYPVLTTNYSDSPSGSFIDDYAATFSITMSQTQGNGSSGLPVHYTEAFLFNGEDDLFSIIRFPYFSGITTSPKGFSKSDQFSYLISWTIKSIV